jgi:hypothetical protein
MDESKIKLEAKTQEELLDSYSELTSKFDLVKTVLKHEGAVYYHQPHDTLISFYGTRELEIVFLDTKIILQQEGTIQLEPSSVLLEKPRHSLILLEHQIENYLPGILKRPSNIKLGFRSYLQQLQEVTLSGKYYFHSAQGRNFIVTCTGSNPNNLLFYRVYEIIAKEKQPLILGRPEPIEI